MVWGLVDEQVTGWGCVHLGVLGAGRAWHRAALTLQLLTSGSDEDHELHTPPSSSFLPWHKGFYKDMLQLLPSAMAKRGIQAVCSIPSNSWSLLSAAQNG